ncbi:MAG: three-Cys-motif partner protein TcmP [Bacillota bacterium]
MTLRIDEIGPWSEIKLDILKDYVKAYSTILAAQRRFKYLYIDAFAGAGRHFSRTTGEMVPGSPLNALLIDPPFTEYHFIDIDRLRVERPNVYVYEGDCNRLLLETIFPRVRYEDFRRALCILDPYGLHLNWEVIQMAGDLKTIDIFLNFPVTDMNRNVLWRAPERVDPRQAERMTRFWGDTTWHDVAYDTTSNLFGLPEKVEMERIVNAFRERLEKVAGFKHVPKPIPMRNSKGAVVYYLFFASPKPVAKNIVRDIFKKHGGRM